MSTQVIRNLLNNQVDSVIAKAKIKAREEGKKQLNKLKNQIPTPQEITEKLKTDIDEASCSEKGKEKFQQKHDDIQAKLDNIKGALDAGISKLTALEEGLNKIVGPAGVLDKIKKMPEILNPIVSSLNVVVQVASALIVGVGFIPPPFTAPSGPLILAKDASGIAKGVVSEFSFLIEAIPSMIDGYAANGNSILSAIKLSLNKLRFLEEKLNKSYTFLAFLKLNFEQKCNDFLNSLNPSLGSCSCPEYSTLTACEAAGCIWTPAGDGIGAIIDGNQISNINDLTLDQLLAATELIYGNMLDDLKNQGDDKAIEKRELLVKEMNEWNKKYNLSFKVIYI